MYVSRLNPNSPRELNGEDHFDSVRESCETVLRVLQIQRGPGCLYYWMVMVIVAVWFRLDELLPGVAVAVTLTTMLSVPVGVK